MQFSSSCDSLHFLRCLQGNAHAFLWPMSGMVKQIMQRPLAICRIRTTYISFFLVRDKAVAHHQPITLCRGIAHRHGTRRTMVPEMTSASVLEPLCKLSRLMRLPGIHAPRCALTLASHRYQHIYFSRHCGCHVVHSSCFHLLNTATYIRLFVQISHWGALKRARVDPR